MLVSDAQLLIIDPQNDFMGEADGLPYISDRHAASLPVAGAIDDMRRAATMVDRVCDEIAAIYVSMCAHHRVYVGHPGFWRDSQGKSPDPFTQIDKTDIIEQRWYPRDPNLQVPIIDYADALDLLGYKIDVWPEHCVIGTWGQSMQVDIADAIARWEHAKHANTDMILKGTSLYREHQGALRAEVHDPSDRSTRMNVKLLEDLRACTGPVGVLGEASSHCVKRTMEQIADFIGEEHLSKFYLLFDCMSPVTGYEETADDFLHKMIELGVNVVRSDEFLT